MFLFVFCAFSIFFSDFSDKQKFVSMYLFFYFLFIANKLFSLHTLKFKSFNIINNIIF